MVDFKPLKAYALKQSSKLIQQEVHKNATTFDNSCRLQLSVMLTHVMGVMSGDSKGCFCLIFCNAN